MGVIRHHAIVVTSDVTGAIELAVNTAREIGLDVLGPSPIVTNNVNTMLVCPDGSKEGWDESDDGDRKRERFMTYLNSTNYDDGSGPLSWVIIAYGDDDASAKIIASKWG